ncbi:hypothetical protein SCUCBS95973_003615 [Sporothrix curviconia]|uniref:Uncharacterized protein n=1 Tax=Sporothrix curviconia TaxID=1260050 RepID=A0ABP0BHY5_9PEZI
MAAQQPPRSQALLDMLEQTIGEVLVHAGKAIRAQSKNGRKVVGSLSATKISDANTAFNSTLDSIETDILRAKATIQRDLDLLRAQKSVAAAAAAAPKKEASQNGAPLYQAPAAAMDIDSDEPKMLGVNVKAEPNTDSTSNSGSNGKPTMGAPANTATMAPFPNMDLDPPLLAMPPSATATSSAMQPSNSNRPTGQAQQAPKIKSPAVKKETLSRSPQKMAKPGSTPGSTTGASPANTAAAGAAGVAANKAPARKRTVSPAAMRVPSPAASRSTASPAATKVPSPVLVKSTAGSSIGSPAIGKASTPQPPTPTPAVGAAVATGGGGKTISLSSSSSSPSITTTSPVLTKKSAAAAAAAKSTPPRVKSTTPVPAPRIPTPIVAPVVPPPTTAAAPATVTPIAPPVPAPAAPVPAMEASSNDINMDDFFDLTGPSGTDDATNTSLGFTNMQFSLVPVPPEQEAKQAQSQPPPPAHIQQQPPRAAVAPQVPQMDDSEFDVESFTADAVQNLLMDTSLPTASIGQLPQQQQSQSNDIIVPDAGLTGAGAGAGATGTADPADDLFSFIDDGMEGLVDDPTTSFDELYMGGTDSIDIDSYFDTN